MNDSFNDWHVMWFPHNNDFVCMQETDILKRNCELMMQPDVDVKDLCLSVGRRPAMMEAEELKKKRRRQLAEREKDDE